jgi:hypothetical protein
VLHVCAGAGDLLEAGWMTGEQRIEVKYQDPIADARV